MSYIFLGLNHVLEIQEEQIQLHGGEFGVRDMNLLESALATPKVTFGGELLHNGPFAIAAAYLFHIVQNHPFVDGNKRAGAAAALVFLKTNDIELEIDDEAMYQLVISVATGQSGKAEIEVVLQKHAIPG